MSVVCSSALRLLAGCDPDPLGVASGDQVSIHASAQEATLCAWGDGGCAPYVSIHASAQEATRQPDRKAGASVFRSTPPRRRRRRWSSLTGLMSMFRRSEEHTSELQSLMRISYAVFCLKKKKNYNNQQDPQKINYKQHIKINKHKNTR